MSNPYYSASGNPGQGAFGYSATVRAEFTSIQAAFDKLPAGTVETLLKPENKGKLTGVLTHHVTTSALEITQFTDGQMVGMADGGSVQVTKKGNDTFIGGAKVLGSVRASNGWVHVIDAVLVPK